MCRIRTVAALITWVFFCPVGCEESSRRVPAPADVNSAVPPDLVVEAQDLAEMDEEPDASQDVSRDADARPRADASDTDDATLGVCGTGVVEGRVCSGSRNTSTCGVTITLEGVGCDGAPTTHALVTDADGRFRFVGVAGGQHRLRSAIGSWRAERDVVVRERATTTVVDDGSEAACWGIGIPRIAVIPGALSSRAHNYLPLREASYVMFNHESLLWPTDTAPRDDDARALLTATEPNVLLSYDILIIDSSYWHLLFDDPARAPERERISENLNHFVASGGNLVVVGWAHVFIESTWPTMVDWYGDDTVESDAKKGSLTPPGEPIQLDVETAYFQACLRLELEGSPVTRLAWEADYFGWVIVEDVDRAFGTAHLVAREIRPYDRPDDPPLRDVPVLFSIQPTSGSGHVFFILDLGSPLLWEVFPLVYLLL